MNQELIEKWLNGTLSEEEKKEFETSDDHRLIREIIARSSSYKAPEYDVEMELERFKSENFTKVRKLKWERVLLPVAASIILVFAVWLFYPANEIRSWEAGIGEKVEFYLPDSSSVSLNASSSISINTKNWEKNREVALNGEAYFKVRKGSEFTVISDQGSVKVLGTQFNVKNRKKFYEVICYEGKVRVNSNNKSVDLEKNELFRVIDTTFFENRHNNISPSWIINESSFSSVPLSEVFEEFERQYGMEFTYVDVPVNKHFTGSFTHNDLTLALKSVTLPMNINFEIVDQKTIVLTGVQE